MKKSSQTLLQRTLSALLMCAMLLTLLPAVALAAGEETVGQRTYYVSTGGKGGNDGLSDTAPLPGLDAVPWDQLLPGDSVLLKKGDTFPGSIRVVDVHGTADAPITIGTYGTGAAPVIETRGQGIWLPETGSRNNFGKYTSSGVLLYDCSYITVTGLNIVNRPDELKTSFVDIAHQHPSAGVDDYTATDHSSDKLAYSGVAVAADGVGAAEGIELTDITVHGDADTVGVITDTSSNIVTSGVTLGAVAPVRTFTNANRAYYVSSLSGSDDNDGSSPAQALYSLHKINELNLQPGAKVYLERGSVFENQYLHLEGGGSAAQPIIIDSYGASSAPKPLINTNGNGVWYQNYRYQLDNTGHLTHGYVSSSILLYDVPYVEVKNIALTNGGHYGETPGADFANLGSYDGGTVPGETGYNTNGNIIGTYTWGGKMCRTGVGGVAQNKGTVHHTVLQNLDIENVFGQIAHKHMDNGGIYFTSSRPLDQEATGIAKFDDLRIEGCYLNHVSRWGIAAVHSTYWCEISPNTMSVVPDEACQTYGATNVYVGHNFLNEVGGDPITLMHAYEPLVEYNVSQNGGREMNGVSGSPTRYMNGSYPNGSGNVSAGIWPWKCKTALFEHNECYTMLYARVDGGVGNNDCQAWDADYGDSTIYQYNYSANNTGGCVMFCLTHAYNTVFRYNISYNDSMANNDRGVLDIVGNTGGQIYNNTFLIMEGANIQRGGHGGSAQIENNIFCNLGNPFTAKWTTMDNGNSNGLTYNNNIYAGFSNTADNDSKAITAAKGDLFADPTFAGAPEAPANTTKAGLNYTANGVRNWARDWGSAFNMFKLADTANNPAVNTGVEHSYKNLIQDADFGVPRVDNDKDFYGRDLDDAHDIGAYDTQTPGNHACELLSSLYELRNTTELQVPFTALNPMTVADFAKGLTVSDGATVKVYQSDGTTEVPGTGNVAADMKVKIVAGDGTTVNTTVYTIKNKNEYNHKTDFVASQQGNVWFHQTRLASTGELLNLPNFAGGNTGYWTGGNYTCAEYNGAGDDHTQSPGTRTYNGTGFVFRAPATGTVTITFPSNDMPKFRYPAKAFVNSFDTHVIIYRNGQPVDGKDYTVPKPTSASAAAVPVTIPDFDLTVRQGDTIEIMAVNTGTFTSAHDSNCADVLFNVAVNYKNEAVTTLPTDTRKPSVPAGLRAKNITEDGATLSWVASTDNVGVDHYAVAVDGGAADNVTGTTKTLTGLTADTEYTVTVKAVDAANNESAEATVTFRTAKAVVDDTQAPGDPTGGQVVSTTSDTATLSWTASADNVGVDHYEVTVNGVTEIAHNAPTVTLTGLNPSTPYTASVVAVDAAGNKSASATALQIAFTTAAAPTPAPLTEPEEGYAVKLSTSSTQLRWRPSDGATGYKVKLGENGAEQDVQDVNRYDLTGLTSNTTYTAYVCAYNGTTTTDWTPITFKTTAVFNAFEDWGNGDQGEVWRYQHQDATGAIVDHTHKESWGWGGQGGQETGYKSVEQNQACGSVTKAQGSGFTFVAPSTGTVQVRFFYYPLKPSETGYVAGQFTEDAVKKRENTSSNGLNHYIRLYVNGKELTKKAITLKEDANVQTVNPVTVSVQAGQQLSILARNEGDFSSTGGNNGVLFTPVITYLNDDYVPEAESAEISQTTATIYTNTTETADRKHTVQLAVTGIEPENANPQITWSILRPGDAGVVSVTQNGLVTALGNSTTPAVVTATISSDYGDIVKTCNVTVRTRMEDITVKKGGTAIADLTEPLTVYANEGDTGRSVTLTAEPTPSNPTHPNLDWSVVEGEGEDLITLVEGANGGSATIAATTNGANVGTAKIQVASHDHDDIHTEFTVRVVRKLANNVSITPAAPKFGQTLTVNTNRLQMTQEGMDGLSYQWYKTEEGETEPTAITGATGRTYKLEDKDDIGAVISVKVTADPDTFYEGEKTASTSAVAKADGGSVASARPENCTTEDDDDGKITGLNSEFEHEYRNVTDPEDEWMTVPQGTTEITGLVPGTYQVRRAKTDTHTAGPVSELKVWSFLDAEGTHAITIGNLKNGEVTPSAWHAQMPTEITLTVVPAEGYQLVKDSLEITYTDASGDEQTETVAADEDGNYTFNMPAADVTVNAQFEKQKFTLDHQLDNIDCDQHANEHEVEYGNTPTITLTAKDGYTMPESITVETEDGEEFEGYQYILISAGKAKIVFDQGITQNLTITGAGVLKSYTVNYNIKNLNAPEDEAPRTVNHHAAYDGKLEPDENYALPELILVKMGGTSFSDFTYDNETGAIHIDAEKITGNLVITGNGVDTRVDPVPVTGVELNQTSASVKVGSTVTLTATVLPDEATEKMVDWSTSDPAVATVDASGKVTGVAEGTATITVTTVDGGVTATCEVTVTKATSSSSRPTTTTTTGTREDGSTVTTVTDNRTGTVTETVEKPDGTVETVETKKDGTKTETVEEPDGTKAVTETKPDGTKTATVEEPDGTKSVTETKPDGSKTATVEQPDGTTSETVVTPEGDATITVTDPEGEELAKVEIPAEVPASDTTFVDTTDHWAKESIDKMAALKLVKGVGEDKYKPTDSMTRGSLATVLHRLSNGKTDYQSVFVDVDNKEWYAAGVAWAAKADVVRGVSEDLFAPDQIITREQLATMLCRYAKLIGMNTKADAKSLESFVDDSAIGGWAVDSMAWCVENGILQGKGQNNLDPTADVSRAEVAVMLDRFIALIK